MASTGLRIRDLGTLLIEFDGQSEAAPRARARDTNGGPAGDRLGRKPMCILSALAVQPNRRVSRDVLVAAAWGERPGTAVGTLESHIWRVRRALEPDRVRGQVPTYLISDGGGYRLAVNPDNVDSLRFGQLAEYGDGLLAAGDAGRAAQRYEAALGLWRGRPFEAVADQEWAGAAVARLSELHMQVREQHVEALLRTGQADRAILLLEQLIADTPLRERVWGQLMLARHQAGRTEEALSAYRQVREVLLEELGLEPGPLLRDLHQRILGQDPSLASPPSIEAGRHAADVAAGARRELSAVDTAPRPRHVELPGGLATLIGREVELDRLTRLMRRARLVTVVGPAGCGKTRLAIEAARAAAHSAPDGVWFVDLTATDDPAAIADTTASVIGLAAPAVGDTRAALRAYLRDRQTLLLFDNCEHLLPDIGELIDDLLSDETDSCILATSREPVGADGEVLWTLSPLPTRQDQDTPPDPSDVLKNSPPVHIATLSPAAQLFTARAERLQPGSPFPCDPHEAAQVEAICAAVDGLPLAIELAAGRIRSASLAEIHAQVTGGLADLARVGRSRVDHHQTVERSIQWSVRLLPEAERLTHARLSVLPGVFTVEAAAAVVGHRPIRPETVPDLLAHLVHRSLLSVVRPTTPEQPTRYRQLATVRAHAARALTRHGGLADDKTDGETDDGETRAAALARRTDFILDLVSRGPAPDAADTAGWYDTVEHNHDTLTAVLHRTLTEQPDPTGVHIIAAVIWYWGYRDRFLEGERWAELALRQQDCDLGDRVLTQLGYASFLALRGHSDQVIAFVCDSIEHADLADRRWFLPLLVGAAIQMWYSQGEPLDVVDDEIARRAVDGDPTLLLYRDLLAARRISLTDEPATAAATAAQLLSRSLQLDNPFAAWLSATLAAICGLLTGDPTTGLEMTRLARRSHHLLGATHEVVYLEGEGSLAVLTGDLPGAARLYSSACAHAFRAGMPWPTSPVTQTMLTQVRQLLPADQYEAAWRAGAAAAT